MSLATYKVLIASVTILIGSGTRGLAQARQTDRVNPLQYEVSVILKLIQVYVLDRSGNPVRDLAKSDFTVVDNGEVVALTDFERHEIRMIAPEKAAPPAEPSPPAQPAREQTINRRFVILFDFAYNTQRGVAAGIKAALDFLDSKVAQEDDVALMSYSALKGLRIHEGLTRDHAQVRKAISGLSAKEISGRADEVEQAYWLLANAAQSGSANAGRAEKELEDHLEPQRRDSTLQAQNYFRSLIRLAQALRLVQGQKNILFFSNGVPSSLINSTRTAGGAIRGQAGTGTYGGSTFEVGNSTLRPLQADMLKEFSASSCSFYAFDTRESSKVPSLFTSDEMMALNRIMVDRDIFRDERTTGMDTLRALAKQTGGKYFSNIQRYENNLEEVAAVTGTYYVLGYSIPAAADGRFHKVKVEVKRKGCQVRTQPGYFDPKPFREYTSLERDLQLFDLALDDRGEKGPARPFSISALSYNAGFGPRVQCLAKIPSAVWADLQDKTAELVAVFFDAQDVMLSLQRAVIAPEDYKGKDILFTAAAAARASGQVKCRLVIRDLETGRSAVASAKAYIGGTDDQTIALGSPLIVVEGGGLYQLEGVVKAGPEGPSWREVYAYDASTISPVVGDDPVTARKATVIVPIACAGAVSGDLAFRANLVNSVSGASLDVPLKSGKLMMRGAQKVQDIEISLADVKSGNYLLYIHVADKASAGSASAFVSLTIAH